MILALQRFFPWVPMAGLIGCAAFGAAPAGVVGATLVPGELVVAVEVPAERRRPARFRSVCDAVRPGHGPAPSRQRPGPEDTLGIFGNV